MRDSRLPRGTWTAPGMWPSSHSSRSRTSTKSASSRSRAPRASTSSISALRPLAGVPCNWAWLSQTIVPRTSRIPGYRGADVSHASPHSRRSVAVAAAARRGRRRRSHARHAAVAGAAAGAEGASRRSSTTCRRRRRREIERRFRAWPTGARHDGAPRPPVPERPGRAALSRDRAALGRVRRRRRRPRCAPRRSIGRDTPCEIQADNLLHPQFFGRLPDLPADSRRTRCSRSGVAAPGGGPPALGASASTQRAARLDARRRRGAGRRRGRPLRQGQPARVVLAPRAADAPIPEEPVRAVLPRADARVDGAARRGDRAVRSARARSTGTSELGREAAQFLARL